MSNNVITRANFPAKTLYLVKDNGKAEKVEIEKDSLPDSLGENHVGKYYYNEKGELYLVVKSDDESSYEVKKITIQEDLLPDPLKQEHVSNYYYAEELPIGVSSFDRIWGTVEDGKGNSITINLQDAMNALYKMMTSQSHVWVGNEDNAPDYAKLLIETDSGNSTNNS